MAEAAAHRLPAARVPRIFPDMGGRGGPSAARSGRSGSRSHPRWQSPNILQPVRLPRGGPGTEAAVGRIRDREGVMKRVILGSLVFLVPDETGQEDEGRWV